MSFANGTAPAQVLELDHVTAGYGQTTVLRDVDLTVDAGTVVALLGPNGAGKTTLLRVAAGLTRASAGEVAVCGQNVTERAPYERVRAGLCLVPEGRGVFPNLTVRENLVLQIPPRSKDVALERAFELFPWLRERLGETAGRLSGGQQQMLALSRCVLAAPRVVLVDEVSMGLAPRLVDEVFAALRRIAGGGVAVLLVEQYVGRALQLANRVYLLDRGSISFAGSPSELDEDTVMRRYLAVDNPSSEELS
jgi:branched-chain amino acid transport system ATP-binding protein